MNIEISKRILSVISILLILYSDSVFAADGDDLPVAGTVIVKDLNSQECLRSGKLSKSYKEGDVVFFVPGELRSGKKKFYIWKEDKSVIFNAECFELVKKSEGREPDPREAWKKKGKKYQFNGKDYYFLPLGKK